MSDGTGIQRQRVVKMEIGKVRRNRETRKKEIGNLTVDVYDTSKISGSEALRGR